MKLKVLLPFGIFAAVDGVSRIVAQSRDKGAFGILPQRLDCVASLAPGILTYEDDTKKEFYLALDEGILVKTGPDVLVSVRYAFAGSDLNELHKVIEREFVNLSDQEKSVRLVTAKLESGLISRLVELSHE